MKLFIKNLLKICWLPITIPAIGIWNLACIFAFCLVWPFITTEEVSVGEILCFEEWKAIFPNFKE